LIEAAPILAIIIPLMGSFLTPLISILTKRYKKERIRDLFVVAITIVTLLLVLYMLPTVWNGNIIVYRLGNWTPPWGICLAIDGLNILVALIVSGIAALVSIYSLMYMKNDTGLGKYYTLLLLILASMMGVTLTGDFFNMFVFFEIMSTAAYALVAFRRNWDSIEASIKYMVMGSLGASLFLLGISFIYNLVGSLNIADIAQKISIIGTNPMPLVLILILALLMTGLSIKIAMVPFHAWMPDAYQAAPSAVVALFAAGTTTVGVYMMLRVVYTLFGVAALGAMLIVLGSVTMVVGALMALVQRDLKRLLAYSGISQVGYILLGVGFGTALGIEGGLFHLLNNAIYKALLFMCAGAILYRVGTTNLDELGGLSKNMPITACLFTIGALAISGVPPFNGFASKWTIYIAGIQAGKAFFTLLAIIVSVLTLAYLLKAVNAIFLGQRPKRFENVKEAPMTMLFPMMLLAVLCIVLGVLPSLGIDIVTPAYNALVNQHGYIHAVLGGI